jgi:hypothetical protein
MEHAPIKEDVPSEIVIDGTMYQHVKTRDYTPVSIFKHGQEFLRLGPKELINPELELHKKILAYGFPVPAIISEGEHEGNIYYIEASLGETLLGNVFWEDCKQDGQINKEHFASFLKLTEAFAEAQLKTATPERDDESFYIGIHMDLMEKELPELKPDLIRAFEKLRERTKSLPTVLTHGDFNAYNLAEGGVIDFGSIHNAPAGYDVVNNIYHTYGFPKSGDFESMRRYEFTEEQITEYFNSLDRIYTQAGLPKISEFKDDFIFAKAIWGTARMHKAPKLQQWRYTKLKKILGEYLSGTSILQTVLKF